MELTANDTPTETNGESHALIQITPQRDPNPAAVYLAALGSEHSRRTMRQALDTMAGIISSGEQNAQTLTWGLLRFQHTQAIRAELARQFKPATGNKMLSALRGTLKAAYRLGYMTNEEYVNATDLKVIKGDSLPTGRELSGGEIRSLVDVCKADLSPTGARDVAMIGILYACGLRRAELVTLDLTDYDGDTGKLIIQHGKGRKARTVYVTGGAKLALEAWLVVRGLSDGPLFCRIRKGGKILLVSQLTTQAVYTILQSRAKQSGVKDFSPHDMRRTFVSDMLDRGADIATVAKLAGHASVTTTARYDRRHEETKRKAAGLLHFPF